MREINSFVEIFKLTEGNKYMPSASRTGTLGFQPKLLENGNVIKGQINYENKLRKDWKVEIIAGEIGRLLKLDVLQHSHCKMMIENGKVIDSVRSTFFLKEGEKNISFAKLVILFENGVEGFDLEYIPKNAVEKLKYMAKIISDITQLNYSNVERYLIDIAVIDAIVCNSDRHYRNISVIKTKDGWRLPPINDNGLGLFVLCEEDESFDMVMRGSYVAPYGEDPFDLLEMLQEEFDIKSKYRIEKLDVEQFDLPNKNSEIYLKKICNWFEWGY